MSGVKTSAPRAFFLVIQRDLRLAFRRPGEWLQPVAFFAIVTLLFPLALDPEPARLRALAPGALWVAALLSSLLAIEFLYRDDGRDGTLEQFALSGQSFASLLFAKTVAHWFLTGVPLAIAAPIAALALGAPPHSLSGVLLALLLGSVSLSLIGAIGAGLTLGIRRGGALLSLLVLPLSIPTLVFGARATELAIAGASGAELAAPLYLLGALAVLGVTLAPLAAAAAVRISLE
ncbi:MAG: heme exporter protein CcmB [Steroidobacteraceae bacterium]